MTLVLQCAMCGTQHPVGTAVCSACGATGVAQLRLMFECPTCGHFGLNPQCGRCPVVVPLDLDDDLIVAEEIADEPDDFHFDLDFELDLGDEAIIVDLTEEPGADSGEDAAPGDEEEGG